jgi:hypothetical protein
MSWSNLANLLRRSITAISVSVSLLTGAAVNGAQGFAVGSLDLGLTDQPGWFVWYNTTDSPEGAFLGTVYETLPSVSGTVQLGRTLQPGRYYAAWKVLDYSSLGTLDFKIGSSATSTTPLNSGDFNGQWTVPVVIDVPVASTTVQITLRRSKPIDARQIFLLRGLYITTSPAEVVFSDDSILIPQFPTQVDGSPARKGNILENSSFEVGTGHGWGLGESTARNFTVASMWDNTVAFEGAASLKVPHSTELVSRPYRVRGNRQFTFSAWVKTAFGGTVTLTIQNGGPYLGPNYHDPVIYTQIFPVNTSWQRVSLSGVLWDYPTSDYYVRLSVSDPQGGYAWVDGLQLEEGGLTDYASGQPLEAGLVCSQPSNLFYEDEPATMQLWVRNSGASPASATLPYEIYDYMNRRVATGSTSVTVPAGGRSSGSLNVSTGQRGIFHAVLWIQGVEHTREEMVYGVVPRPQQTGLDTSSLIGIHANFTDFQSTALQKLGIKWNRASSPSRAFRWATIEPTEGAFQWTPDDMTTATSHGISVLGTLGLDWPAWADAGGLPDLAKWETFVGGVVSHYKDQVKYWEIWNEPQYWFTPNFYGQLLQRAVSAIRAADPQAQIVGLGGVADLTWCTNVLSSLGNTWVTNLTAVSTHLYPKFNYQAYSDFRNYVRDPYNLPVWNTEVGVWDRGFYMAENSDFVQTDYTWPQKAADRYDYGHKGAAELLSYAFLNNVGNGLSKFFYYDGRIYVGPAFSYSHPTLFEYDDSIRAKGVALAALARLFDHSAGLGDISPNASSSMFLFDRGGTPLVGMWSLDRTNRSLTLSLSGSSYKVYDLMGNPITISNGTIPYGGTPVYVEGQGISVATLRAAVQAGTVAVRADTTPPNLSLVIFPTGPTQENPVKFRWLAVDETSSSSDGSPKAIEYSYYLQGYDAGWSPWFPGTFVDYLNLVPGTYQFQVRARDAAGNMSSTSHVAVVVGEPTSSSTPVLAAINDQTIDELALLTVINSATDSDLPAQTLTFALVSAPGGVTLDSVTGVLTWRPTEAHGPGGYPITLRVFDNGSPSLSATQSFTVFVNEVNSAPVLAAINDQTIDELALLTVTASASDSDLPAQTLTFALVSAPGGVTLDSVTGVLTWRPTAAHGPGGYLITLRVFDSGSPSLSATQSFTVVVNDVNPIQPLRFITSSALVASGVFRVQVVGGTNQGSIVIESSNNLLQWIPVYTNSATGGLFEFSDLTPRSFYRAKEQP